jgi:hypothetical protein
MRRILEDFQKENFVEISKGDFKRRFQKENFVAMIQRKTDLQFSF